jgi:hypothetical protein
MKKLILSVSIFTFLTTSLLAQETVYFKKDSGKSSSSKKKEKSSSELNIIKIAPLSFIGGNLPIFYERSITPTFAIQVGVGITMKNYINDALKEAGNGGNSGSSYPSQTIVWQDGTINTYSDDSYDKSIDNKRKSTTGYFFAIEPKIYFENEGLEGGFISFTFNTGKYNNTVGTIKTGTTTSSIPTLNGGTFAGYDKITNLLVNYGSQTLYDHISLEYSVGIGLKKISALNYAYSTDNTGKYVEGVGTTDATTLGYNIAFRVGYHF